MNDSKKHHAISDEGRYGVRAHLGYRGSPPKREGDKHPRMSDVNQYNERYVSAIGTGLSLVDALEFARRIA